MKVVGTFLRIKMMNGNVAIRYVHPIANKMHEAMNARLLKRAMSDTQNIGISFNAMPRLKIPSAANARQNRRSS